MCEMSLRLDMLLAAGQGKFVHIPGLLVMPFVMAGLAGSSGVRIVMANSILHTITRSVGR